MQPVIQSLLDTDLYKFTMWQTMLHRHPQTQAEYTFVCRNEPAYPLAELLPDVNQQLDHLCSLRFDAGELAYLGELRFMRSDFVDFLRIFQFQREFISARANGTKLEIVANGPQVTADDLPPGYGQHASDDKTQQPEAGASATPPPGCGSHRSPVARISGAGR